MNRFRMYHLDQRISVPMTEIERTVRYEELSRIIEIDETLPEEEMEAVKNIYKQNCDIFQLPSDKLTFTPVRQFKLPLLEGAAIVNKKQYCVYLSCHSKNYA